MGIRKAFHPILIVGMLAFLAESQTAIGLEFRIGYSGRKPPRALITDLLVIEHPQKSPWTWTIGKGGITHTGSRTPRCITDSGQILERQLMRLAFPLEEVNPYGQPGTMLAYACEIPDSLHPEFPCTPTAIGKSAAKPPPPPWEADGARRLDGRRLKGLRTAPRPAPSRAESPGRSSTSP